MAKLKRNIDKLNYVLGRLPKRLYHGRIGKSLIGKLDDFEITIYNNANEVEGLTFLDYVGRTHLDCAFHGFYLTPCEALARKWALTKSPKKDEVYQILIYEVDIESLDKLNSKINIVPDDEWAEHVYSNRAKKVIENQYDFVYNFIADGQMAEIEPKIIDGQYDCDLKAFHSDILKDRHISFINDFYSKRTHGTKEIFDFCNLIDYKNYQLCVTSEKALQFIKLIDIIELPYDHMVVSPIIIDVHLEEYKKTIPWEWIIEIQQLKGV